MKTTWIASIASVLLSMTGAANAQSTPERTSSAESASNVSAGSAHVENGLPISRLLATVDALDVGEPYTPEKCEAHDSSK